MNLRTPIIERNEHPMRTDEDPMAKDESTMNRTGAAYALCILFAINAINFFDRQIGGVLAEPVRKEWGLTDTQVGWLATAFTLLYAAVGVPLGRLADRSNRSRILAAGVFFWSLMTAASGLTRNFWQLFLVRLGVGVGEATCAPASASLDRRSLPTAAACEGDVRSS